VQRVLRNTGASIGVTVSVDDVATDPAPDSATIAVTREDGTALVAANTSTTNTGTGTFSFSLTPTHTALLDVLKATWTITRSGNVEQLVTYHEVVGGHVCTLPQIDANLAKGGTASGYSLGDKQAARDVATDAFELECGVAFTPRYRRLTVDGTSTTDLFLPDPRVISITSATVDGSALTVGDLGIYDNGSLYSATGWAAGRRNVVLKYEHGYMSPPADVSRAVAMIAASVLKDGPFDDRGYAVTEDGGGVRLLTAGISGAAFSIPDVEAALQRHRYLTVA